MIRPWFATVVCVIGFGLIIQANIAQAGLEDILYEKGQITKEEWLKAKADQEKAAEPTDALGEWKKKVEKLAILSDKVNIGINALQMQYLNNDAPVAGVGNSDNRFFIRRAEFIVWGKVNEYVPKWQILPDFAANSNIGRSSGLNSNSVSGTGTDNNQILREAFVEVVPMLSLQPYLDKVVIGQYRIPVGIEGSTSSGLIDFINRNYLTQTPATSGNTTGTAAAGTLTSSIDFVQERDLYVNFKSKPIEQLELDLGIMNGNGINGVSSAIDNNSQKDFFGRARVKPRKDMFLSFSTIQGTSTNNNSRNGGRGRGNYDRYIADFQFTPDFLPGLWIQGEWAWGHDAAPAQVTDLYAAGARGEVRSGWYVYGKYLFQDGPLKNLELLARYEQFDPSHNVSNDMLTRSTVGINYYFANMPPKIQSKLQLNYEFRHHQGNGPNTAVTAFDEFANNALLLQFQIRWM